MNILTFPLISIQQLLHRMVAAPEQSQHLRLISCQRDVDAEWLVGPLLNEGLVHPLYPTSSLIRVVRSATPPSIPRLWSPPVVAELVLGAARWEGQWWGYARQGPNTVPLHELRLVGSGLHRLTAMGATPAFPHVRLGSAVRWSRTVGALGGDEALQRLTRLKVAVVGCGRSGSVMAEQLARLGIAEMVLIDPDLVELHNVGKWRWSQWTILGG